MALPTVPTEPSSVGVNPILIVVGTLLTVAVATFLIYTVGGYKAMDTAGDGRTANLAGSASGAGACGQETPADPSYTVDLGPNAEMLRPEGATVVLNLRHQGRAIVGAKVCVTSDMPEMQHPAINALAKEASSGRYEARFQFGMGGTWRTWVTIAESGKPAVSVPLTIQVAQVGPS